MPGSPPTRRADPATRPPPQTRSNSAMPLVRRGGIVVLPRRPTMSIGRPLPPPLPLAPMPFGTASRGASSTRLFQAPQLSQRPTHLACTAPHSWQTKRACARAMSDTSEWRAWQKETLEPRRHEEHEDIHLALRASYPSSCLRVFVVQASRRVNAREPAS